MTEGVSVFVVTPDEQTARTVGPELARQTYPDMKLTGRVLHSEWIGTPEGYTLPGFEVVVEVDDRCQECGATDVEHMGHFARCTQWTPR